MQRRSSSYSTLEPGSADVIIGVGLDLASVAFWEDALADPSTSVIEGTFTAAERMDAAAGPTPEAHRLAARLAAKEAFIKAISSGRYGMEPLLSQLGNLHIEVLLDPHGRPSLGLHGSARDLAESRGVRHIWLSLTHEDQNAAAVVILEG